MSERARSRPRASRTRPLFAYFGHHKCASTWITGIVAGLCHRLGLRLDTVYVPESFGHDLPAFVEARKTEFLCYGNADIAHVRGLGPFSGFHVIRDPRDVVVSGYYSHLHSHSLTARLPIAEHRERLRGLPTAEGLLAEMDFCRGFFEQMASWDYELPHVAEIRFEDMVRDPYAVLVGAFSAMGLVTKGPYELRRRAAFLAREALGRLLRDHRRPWPARLLLRGRMHEDELVAVLYRHRFSAVAGGRRPGAEDRHAHYRKGIAGDWVGHFEPVHKAYFKERYGELLIQLGYAADTDW